MSRRMLTADQKMNMSRAQKASWARRHARQTTAQTTAQTNGLSVSTRIVLHVHDQEFILNIGEARQLREQLTAALVPTEPTHE